ncbi:MAG: GTP-binding protein [Eggerthella lenta]
MNINNVVFERSFGVSSQLTPSTMPEIAFAGRSNVGKSSLLNKLFNRKGLAKVSQTPGKTATINFFSCDGVRFVDLPGMLRQVSKSDKSRWSELIEATSTRIATSRGGFARGYPPRGIRPRHEHDRLLQRPSCRSP